MTTKQTQSVDSVLADAYKCLKHYRQIMNEQLINGNKHDSDEWDWLQSTDYVLKNIEEALWIKKQGT